jgi:hypothetical protein
MIGLASSDAHPARTPVLARLLAGMALLGTAMTGAAVITPGLAQARGSGHADYAVIAGTGLVMIVLSSLFLAYAGRVVGLGLAWLGLAVLTNALFLAGRFVLAPYAFYQTTFVRGDPLMDVTSPDFFPILGAALLVVYSAALAVLYVWQRGRVRRELRPQESPSRREEALAVALTLALVLAPLVALSALRLAGYGLFLVTATSGAAILIGLVAAVLGAGATVRAATDSISVKRTAVLASAFWLALSLLLVYHFVWVVFMTVLISLWPLKVVSPSGK